MQALLKNKTARFVFGVLGIAITAAWMIVNSGKGVDWRTQGPLFFAAGIMQGSWITALVISRVLMIWNKRNPVSFLAAILWMGTIALNVLIISKSTFTFVNTPVWYTVLGLLFIGGQIVIDSAEVENVEAVKKLEPKK